MTVCKVYPYSITLIDYFKVLIHTYDCVTKIIELILLKQIFHDVWY